MTASTGMGITFSIEDPGSPGTYLAIATVIDADWPALRKILVETTAHDSPGGYKEHTDSGLREMGEFTVTLGWDDTEATHGEILTAWGLNVLWSYQIESPDASENIEFDAFMTEMARASQKDSYYQMTITFQPTGIPVIT